MHCMALFERPKALRRRSRLRALAARMAPGMAAKAARAHSCVRRDGGAKQAVRWGAWLIRASQVLSSQSMTGTTSGHSKKACERVSTLPATRQPGASHTAHLLAPRLRAQLLRTRGQKCFTAPADVTHPPTGDTEMTVDGGVTRPPPNGREPCAEKRHRRRSERLGRGEGRLLRSNKPGASRLASFSAAGGMPTAKARRRQCSSRPRTPNCSNRPPDEAQARGQRRHFKARATQSAGPGSPARGQTVKAGAPAR